jgi:hypothetical protein
MERPGKGCVDPAGVYRALCLPIAGPRRAAEGDGGTDRL